MFHILCQLNCCTVRSARASTCKYLTQKQKTIRKSCPCHANWMKLRTQSYRLLCLKVCIVGFVDKVKHVQERSLFILLYKKCISSLDDKASTNPVLLICLCFMILHNTDMHIMGILRPSLRAGLPVASHNSMLRLVNMSPRLKKCAHLCGNQRHCNW